VVDHDVPAGTYCLCHACANGINGAGEESEMVVDWVVLADSAVSGKHLLVDRESHDAF
jgi:hypothetical protein